MSKPHCCPVCGGNGLVPNGFYNKVGNTWASTNASPETCRSCKGTGIVWGDEVSEIQTIMVDTIKSTRESGKVIGDALKQVESAVSGN